MKRLPMPARKPNEQPPTSTLIHLSPNQSTEDALKIIFKSLSHTIQTNRSGIIQDTDPEYLHTFRVAIRKTRSALVQMKSFLPDAELAHFKTHFKTVAQTTNRLRDLDVYLSQKHTYQTLLPPNLQTGLMDLFKHLQNERKQIYKNVARQLKAKPYTQQMQAWETFLQKPWHQHTKPILPTSKKAIYKQYQKVIKQGARITENTPIKIQHNLRIQCKKLRYLLEFFISLYPLSKTQTRIKQLKIVQDHLGEVNDLAVHQQDLMHFLNTSLQHCPSKNQNKIAAALGGLMTQLRHKQNQMQNNFQPLFLQFSSTKNQKKFKALFKP